MSGLLTPDVKLRHLFCGERAAVRGCRFESRQVRVGGGVPQVREHADQRGIARLGEQPVIHLDIGDFAVSPRDGGGLKVVEGGELAEIRVLGYIDAESCELSDQRLTIAMPVA